jgi:hypothetical protein
MGTKLDIIIREGHRSVVFENRLLRRIFGSKREEVTGDWRRQHDEELHNLNTSTHTICVKFKEDTRDGICSWHGRDEKWIKSYGWKACREETTRKTKM